MRDTTVLDSKMDVLNASRFRNIALKSVREHENMDSGGLEQLVNVASFICSTLDGEDDLPQTGVLLRSQLEDLKSELAKRLQRVKKIELSKSKKSILEGTFRQEECHLDQKVATSGVRGASNENLSEKSSGERVHSLLQEQKLISTQEIEEEKKAQALLTAELVDLTGILKEATMQISNSLTEQNQQLESIQHHASDNFDELSRQKKKMSEREKVMKRSFFSSLGSVLWVILLFVMTYGVIRFVPKPS